MTNRRFRLPGILALAVVMNLFASVMALALAGGSSSSHQASPVFVAVTRTSLTPTTQKRLPEKVPATTTTSTSIRPATTVRPIPTTLPHIAVTAASRSQRVAAASVASVGADISWPQEDVPDPGSPSGSKNPCQIKPPFTPALLSGTGFASVGINHGRPMTRNQCLPQEAVMLSGVPASYYANTALPPASQAAPFENGPEPCPAEIASGPECAAYKYGFSAGNYDVGILKQQQSFRELWLDVETGNDWSATASLNRAAIQGVVDAVLTAAQQPDGNISLAGIYSTNHQWNVVTGGWRIAAALPARWYPPGAIAPAGTAFPAVWYATAQQSAKTARDFCPEYKNGVTINPYGFTGGLVTLVQYMSDPRIDNDARC